MHLWFREKKRFQHFHTTQDKGFPLSVEETQNGEVTFHVGWLCKGMGV